MPPNPIFSGSAPTLDTGAKEMIQPLVVWTRSVRGVGKYTAEEFGSVCGDVGLLAYEGGL
jgi:hypothetical protein